MISNPDHFAELETKIIRTIDLVKTTRQDLAAARAQIKHGTRTGAVETRTRFGEE